MSYLEIKYEVTDYVATITMYRPARKNAYSDFMRDEMMAALGQAEQDPLVRAIIITGSEEGQVFCAGMDLESKDKAFNYQGTSELEHRDGGGILTLRLFDCFKPVIAAVNGAAVGIGATMILPMDIRIASSKARFGYVFARRGIVLDACASWFLPKVVGISQASEWALTGRIFSAEEALKAGLISQVVEPENLMPAAYAIAQEIAKNAAPVSASLTKSLVWRMLGQPHPMDAHKIESRIYHWIGQQEDAKEGINSFLEKRPPNFTMDPARNMPPVYPWWKNRTIKD